ncbi:MAG: right-handed parallel beta-helix repeat-containing protein [Rikenellaceae bacterium]
MKFLSLFLLLSLSISGVVANDFVTVNSIAELQKAIAKDGGNIRLKPAEYTIDSKSYVSNQEFDAYKNGKLLDAKFKVNSILNFSGNNNTVDLSGSTIKIDTKLLGQFGAVELAQALISGNDNYITGLKIVDFGNKTPGKGSNTIYLMGDRNTLDKADTYSEGSSPYGYGHLLGKGAGSMVKLRKQCVLLIAGVDCKVINSKFLTHAYGHGIYLQGAVNTWIENCVVEGQMRSTDEMLAEKSGPAFDAKFKTIYHPGYIVKGEMKALSEDAYRIYASGINGRKTVGLNVVNCKAIRMRTGFDVSLGSPEGDLRIINCEAIECQFGYSLNSGAVVEGCKGDLMYGPILTFPYPRGRGSKVDLTITSDKSKYPYARAAEINGSNHDISIKIATGVESNLPIVFGESFRCDAALFRDPKTDVNKASGATNVKLTNSSKLPIEISARGKKCTISTNGKVTDNGSENNISKM